MNSDSINIVNLYVRSVGQTKFTRNGLKRKCHLHLHVITAVEMNVSSSCNLMRTSFQKEIKKRKDKVKLNIR